MQCRHCGSSISSNSQFCMFCGTPVQQEPSHNEPKRPIRWETATIEYHEPKGTNLLGWMFTGPYGYGEVHGKSPRQRLSEEEVKKALVWMGQKGWELVSTHVQPNEAWDITVYEYKRPIHD